METVLAQPQRSERHLNVGSLLRLFKSGFFDSWLGVSYLYKYPASPGVHDYLCNELYNLPDDDIEFYLVQLCNLLLYQNYPSNSLERFLMDKCSQSIHFALKISWIFQAYVEDPSTPKDIETRCIRLREDCEIATVNCRRPTMARSASVSENLSQLSHVVNRTSNHSRHRSQVSIATLEIDSESKVDSDVDPSDSNSDPKIDETDLMIDFAISKKERCEYFYKVTHFVEQLEAISDRVLALPVPERQRGLEEEICKLNQGLTPGIYLPLWRSSDPHHSIVRIPPEHCKVLKSRERVPYRLDFEILESRQECSAPNLHELTMAYDSMLENAKKRSSTKQVQRDVEELAEILRKTSMDYSHSHPMASNDSASPFVDRAPDSAEQTAQAAAVATAKKVEKEKAQSKKLSDKNDPFSHLSEEPFAELWADKVNAIRASSPCGHLQNWRCASVIMKTGDDCRQEQLAVQLISQFQKIFQDARLPLFLRPYFILVTSATSGIIETVPDTISIHQLKKLTSSASYPYGVTLAEFFRHRFGNEDSEEYLNARRNFVESMAAYSLVCYLLQIKDRHNGNILLDAQGHIIHIDFGFMLSNSPGNWGWETSPFKLSEEMVEVMGGVDSTMYYYFKALLLRGFLEVRKYADKIVLLVEMSYCENSPLSCFAAGPTAMDALRRRFMLGLTEDDCVKYVEGLISSSLNNWKTRKYDAYQYYTNGILY